MKSTKPHRISTLKSSYGELTPDGWAVTRMKARLAREKYDPAERIPGMVIAVFRRYVLATVLTLFAVTAWLDYTADSVQYASEPLEIQNWLIGENGDDIAHEIPEFTFLMDF